jgi:hypothetical protein
VSVYVATAACPLSALCAACTAFPTWVDLLYAMDRGYVPTLFGTTRRQLLLRKAIKAAGYSVWPKLPR